MRVFENTRKISNTFFYFFFFAFLEAQTLNINKPLYLKIPMTFVFD